MKTQWTKLLVVLLALAMALSLAACGEKKPAEATPGSTPTQSSPEAPASSPEAPASSPEAPASSPEAPASSPEAPASSPEAPASSDPAGKESSPEAPASSPEAPASSPEAPASSPEAPASSPEAPESSEPETPAETPVAVTPSTPAGKTDKGNNVYEVNKSETALTVDGVMDAAYANGIVLVATNNLPESGSTFRIYFAADETHIYVIYEFIKNEQIFYKADYTTYYHMDCADFLLSLGAAEAQGTEFHILGGVEGPKGTAAISTYSPESAGVDNWYVKHTKFGYNVEFSIPLEKVTGIDANGDKAISFTAVSTITTSWTDTAPVRSYAYVTDAFGSTATNDAKKNPSILVVKGTKVEGGPDRTEDGRYAYTLNAVREALKVDGEMDAAYANGLAWDAIYQMPTEEEYGFTVYLAADAKFVYVFYAVKDQKVVGADNASAWYRGDCIDFLFGPNAEAELGNDMRIFGDKEGGMGVADARGVYAAVKELYVKTTEVGYNVEFKLDRSTFADSTVFSFLAMSGACRTDKAETGTTSTTVYPCIDNASGGGSNGGAKTKLNQVTIVDLPPETTEDGRYMYTLNAGIEALKVDGTMDAAYANGLSWKAKYNTPASYPDDNATKKLFANPEKNTFTVYMAADANYVYVLYVVEDEFIVGQAKASAWYRADCADFLLGPNNEASLGNDMRIFGDKEGGMGVADVKGQYAAVKDLYVKTTEVGYNVEFKIDRTAFANANVFSFLAMGGACAVETTSATVYPCIENGAGEGGNPAKAKLNQVTIVDATVEAPATETTQTSTTTAGNWVYEVETTTSVKVDGNADGAYYTKGVYLKGAYRLPADSNSNFKVYFIAGETHFYVLYEFTKEEGIFYDAAYKNGGSPHHFDCVDFVLGLGGLETTGVEFHIWGGTEGDINTAIHDIATKCPGAVDALYVKHTDKGYNVEFSIPYERVTGIDANGNKKISFTALSTITTAYDKDAATTVRVYTVATKAAGEEAKAKPSILVAKGTATEDSPALTADGRYLYTLTAAKTALATMADVKAAAQNGGLVFDGIYCDGPATFLNETNNYKAYIAADAESLYVLFEVNDSNLVAPGGASYWQNDCTEIDIDVTGGTSTGSTQLRVWGAAAGTNHYVAGDAYGAWHNNGGALGVLNNAITNGIMKSYTVEVTETGYNVLYTFNRAALKDGNTVAMYFSIALGDVVDPAAATPTYNRAYVTTANIYGGAGNAAKPYANVFKIVDAE